MTGHAGKKHAKKGKMQRKRNVSGGGSKAEPVQRLQKKACNAYVSPAANAQVVAYQETVLKWDPSCLSSYTDMDIYLQSIDAAQPIHLWQSVPVASGSLATSFSPDWWNSTAHLTTLQLVFTQSGQPSWAGLSPGPVFSATWDGTVPTANASSTVSAKVGDYTGPSVENVSGAMEHHSSGLGGGKLAAAVLVPLLALISLVAGYVVYSRRKSAAESKRWSNYVDQRMSMVSQNWQPQTGAGHNRGASHGTFGNRASAASFNRAGFGVPGVEGPRVPEMVQTDRRSFASSAGARQSRVSFAISSSPTPGSEGNRSSKQLSHLNVSRSSLSRFLGSNPSTDRDLVLSPDQEDGPRVLDERTIVETRLAKSLGLTPSPKPSPALTTASERSPSPSQKKELGRPKVTGQNRSISGLRYEIGESDPQTGAAKVVLGSETPEPQLRLQDTHQGINRPFQTGATSVPALAGRPDSPTAEEALAHGAASGMRRLSNVRTSTMSPDEALRQYTLQRRVGSPPNAGGSPAPSSVGVASTNGNGMRVLYSPTAFSSTASPPPGATGGQEVGSARSSGAGAGETDSALDGGSGEDRPEEAVISRARSLTRPFRSNNPYSQYTVGGRTVNGQSIYSDGSRYSVDADGVPIPPAAQNAANAGQGRYGFAS